MYWGHRSPPGTCYPPKEIAIHARRGDMAKPSLISHEIGGVWSAVFYQDCVDQLKSRFPNSNITIYSERDRSDDLLVLKNCTLDFGGRNDFGRHFRKMVSADLFVPACSSVSTWAAYITKGRVFVYNKDNIKHFHHQVMPKNFVAVEI
jgi:hypothetical protein